MPPDTQIPKYYLELYKRWGLSIIPIANKSKKPLVKWEEYQHRQPFDGEIAEWWDKYWSEGKANIGIVCGNASDNLVVLDFDSQSKYEEFVLGQPQLYKKTPVMKTSRGYHIYLRTKEPVKSQKLDSIDIKGEGGYVLAPPSIHPDGPVYQFKNPDVTEILQINSLEDIGINIEKPEVIYKDPGWVSQLLEQGVNEGARNDSAARLAGYFHNLMPQDVAEHILMDWNTHNTPPLPEDELRRTIASIYRLPEHTPIYGNNKYSLINNGVNATLDIAKTGQIAGQNRDISGIKSGSISKLFDEIMRENVGEWQSKKEIAGQIGTYSGHDAFRKHIQRLKKDGKLRQHKSRPDLIMWINRSFKETDLSLDNDGDWIETRLPLALHKQILVPKGSIGVNAGVTSSGKTALQLGIAEEVLRSTDMEVWYWFNEMSEARLRIRMQDFPYLVEMQKAGRFHPVEQVGFEFKDVLVEGACNLVDYLRRSDEFFRLAGDIDEMHKRIGAGMLWVGLQKADGPRVTEGYGGLPTTWLSNIYLLLDKESEQSNGFHGRMTIRKAKDYAESNNNPCWKHVNYHTGGKHGRLYQDGIWGR